MLKIQQNEFHIEVGDYHIPMSEEMGDDNLLEANYLEKKTSGKTKLAYAELFHD